MPALINASYEPTSVNDSGKQKAMSTDPDWVPDEFWEDSNPLLTTRDVGDWFHVRPAFVRKLIHSGEIEAYFLAGEYLVETSAVRAYIDSHTIPANPDWENGPDNGRLF